MRVFRLIGLLLLIVAAITFLRDALNWYDSGTFDPMSFDQLWLAFAPDGYENAQFWAATNLSVAWDPIAVTLLALPAFVTSAVPGILLVLATRGRKKKNSRTGSNLRQVYD